MALVLKDRVKESSASSGTGSITLSGAFPGYQTFNTSIASGSTVYYTIHNLAAGFDTEWEVGVGTFTSPSTLSRDTVLSSSVGAPTKTNFTSGTEGLEVFVTQPAEEAVYINQATGKVEAFGNGTNTITFTEINTTNLTANTVTLTAGTITTNAANNTDITNKQYVDGLFSQGISYHDPVLVESPTALNAVYVQPNGAGNGVGATLTNNGANAALVIDGVTLSNTARVLVYQQANAVQNGIYTVTNPGNVSAQWVLTRATDADTFGLADPNKLGQGDAVFVQSGNTGAGETYVCTTPGTITFGSTNITFAQISSAQIYAAGTGLNLSNLTFSIANTTVVSGLYGDSANVAVIEVNAQGQLTSASNSAINVSNITVGTLSNDRTTASASNGANTIVLRDANGSFNANVGTFTTVNATNGNFTNISANGVGLTDINASNITSGTISNARTTGNTANSANTLVLRDADGNFGSNVITASLFSGDGSGINAINASNISSGTIANARTTAASANGASTIVLRDSGGSFEANTVNAVSLIGNAAQVTAINASNISSGTIANAYTTANSSNGASTIVLRGASGEFAAGAITGTSFSGNVSATVGTFGSGSNTAPSITFTGDTNTGIFSPAADTIAFTEGGVESMRIDSSGNVGIGTDSPAYRLQVRRSGGAGSLGVTINNTVGFTRDVQYYSVADSTSDTTGHAFYVRNGSATDNLAMRIASDGNVGIGTSSPGSRLAILESTNGNSILNVRNTNAGSSATSILALGNDGALNGAYLVLNSSTNTAGGSGNSLNITNGFNAPMTFATNNTERMRIASDGSVGIGITNPNSYGKLAVNGDVGISGGQYLYLYNSVNSNYSAIRCVDTTGTAFYTAATERMRISASGGVSIGNTTDAGATNLLVTGTVTGSSFIASSDERLKENWENLAPDFVQKLAQVKNGSFNRIGNDTRETGVTAQSLQKVMPEAVIEGADGYLSVNYGGAALVAAIELAKVVEDLRKEVAELRAELKAK